MRLPSLAFSDPALEATYIASTFRNSYRPTLALAATFIPLPLLQAWTLPSGRLRTRALMTMGSAALGLVGFVAVHRHADERRDLPVTGGILRDARVPHRLHQ